jgi:hypothetical protein
MIMACLAAFAAGFILWEAVAFWQVVKFKKRGK